MLFYPRFQYPVESTMSFPTDILQLLGDTNNRPTTRSAFSPNFDVHETKDSYVLEGEFPGVSDKKNISIEFTDDKTLVVQGRVEKSLEGWRDEKGKVKEIESSSEEQKKIEGSADQKAEGKKETEKKKEKEKEEAGPKVWISERSTGEFSRSFRFPSDIDVERVKASLEHGILKVVVPKMEKRGTKKIQIS